MTAKPRVSDELIHLAHRLTDASGAIISRYYRAKMDVETKDDQSPVTRADKEAEQAIRQILEKERPNDSIHGEEFGSSTKRDGFLWVIDPIDGTKAFATGRPLFGTLIGLFIDGIPALGMIDQPVTKERWIGAVGHGTALNGTPVRCRPCATLPQAQIATTGPSVFKREDYLKFLDITNRSSFTVYGGDCYSYGQLACGFLDSVIEGALKLHDYAALIPVVESAGGKITTWQNTPLGVEDGNSVIASGDARLHDELCGLLSGLN